MKRVVSRRPEMLVVLSGFVAVADPAAERPCQSGPFPLELKFPCGIATAVLNEHVNSADMCATCGSAWPCAPNPPPVRPPTEAGHKSR